MRVITLAKTYGMTADEYDAMLAAQGGVCAICGKAERAPRIRATRQLSVDHDHKTGVVRGLLCSACNRAIGLIGDDMEVLRNALAYLVRASGAP
jgi:Recombination endonuclease VII